MNSGVFGFRSLLGVGREGEQKDDIGILGLLKIERR
jgi:hypothetical protein